MIKGNDFGKFNFVAESEFVRETTATKTNSIESFIKAVDAQIAFVKEKIENPSAKIKRAWFIEKDSKILLQFKYGNLAFNLVGKSSPIISVDNYKGILEALTIAKDVAPLSPYKERIEEACKKMKEERKAAREKNAEKKKAEAEAK